jgi:hypothetical protein
MLNEEVCVVNDELEMKIDEVDVGTTIGNGLGVIITFGFTGTMAGDIILALRIEFSSA